MDKVIEKLPHTRVTIELKKQQRRGYNDYECSINGSVRNVTMRKVTYFVESFIDALTSFNPVEVVKVEIVDTWEEKINNQTYG
jgi:hypothetical protein